MIDVLRRQVERLDRRLVRLEQVSRRYSTARVMAALAMMAAGVLALTWEGDARPYWVITGAALSVFVLLVVLHDSLKRGTDRFTLWRRIKRQHIARLMLDWDALPLADAPTDAPDHPFEIDLDVTGQTGLHRLLDTAATREGSDRLRAWLLATAPDPDTIRQRQARVGALKTMSVFRDKLALYGGGVRRMGHGLAGLDSADRVDTRAVLALTAFAFANLLLLIGDALSLIPPVWRLTIPAYFIGFLFAGRRIGDLFQASLSARETVERLHTVFHYLESAPFARHPALKPLCAPFLDAAQRPTRELARIRRVLIAASLRSNLVLWLPLNLFMPFDLGVAWALDRVNRRLARVMPQWLDAWFELEALCALATYADLHPNAVFPVIEAGAAFEAQALGHPLMHDEVKVRNDFGLQDAGCLVIVTGSNMAGKSSFLRALGLALCMAYAGGVVDAASLRVSAFRLYTCIRVSDSVVEGFSYFYAEVRRLKALLNALEGESPYPLFFLIDEIFKGTNNRERLIGSRSYIRALVKQRGMGVISTHDLELVALADELPGVSNAHFREQVIDGRMVFDYKLRAGPSPTTNALKIMRLAGLPVEGDST